MTSLYKEKARKVGHLWFYAHFTILSSCASNIHQILTGHTLTICDQPAAWPKLRSILDWNIFKHWWILCSLAFNCFFFTFRFSKDLGLLFWHFRLTQCLGTLALQPDPHPSKCFFFDIYFKQHLAVHVCI